MKVKTSDSDIIAAADELIELLCEKDLSELDELSDIESFHFDKN